MTERMLRWHLLVGMAGAAFHAWDDRFAMRVIKMLRSCRGLLLPACGSRLPCAPRRLTSTWPSTPRPWLQALVEKKRRLRRGRRRQVRLGETIYKGHRSYDLMLNLQVGSVESWVGWRYSVCVVAGVRVGLWVADGVGSIVQGSGRQHFMAERKICEMCYPGCAESAGATPLLHVIQAVCGLLIHKFLRTLPTPVILPGHLPGPSTRNPLTHPHPSPSSRLWLTLQLGIRYTITTLNKLPPPKVIMDAHFKEKVGACLPPCPPACPPACLPAHNAD